MSRTWPWFLLAAVIIVADQITKAIVLAHFAPGERVAVTGFFNLVLVFNKGAAFSFLAGAGGWQTCCSRPSRSSRRSWFRCCWCAIPAAGCFRSAWP